MSAASMRDRAIPEVPVEVLPGDQAPCADVNGC